jgi:hypothetical protein
MHIKPNVYTYTLPNSLLLDANDVKFLYFNTPSRASPANWLYLLSPKQLHPQQGEDEDEEKEQEQQADDGAHTVEQRDDQVPQGGPVPGVTYMDNHVLKDDQYLEQHTRTIMC